MVTAFSGAFSALPGARDHDVACCSAAERSVLCVLCDRAAALSLREPRVQARLVQADPRGLAWPAYLFCAAVFVLYGLTIAEPTGADVTSGGMMRFFHELFPGTPWEMEEDGSAFPVDSELSDARAAADAARAGFLRASQATLHRRARVLSGLSGSEPLPAMLEARRLERMLETKARVASLKAAKSAAAPPRGSVAFPLSSFERLAVKLALDPKAVAAMKTLREPALTSRERLKVDGPGT